MQNSLNIYLLHALPGRVRMKLSASPMDMKRFQRAMLSHEGVHSADYNPISSSLLVRYTVGHLTKEEIVMRAAIALSMERSYDPVQVHLGEGAEVMTDAAIFAGLLLLAAGGARLFNNPIVTKWLSRSAGISVATAVAEHGYKEIREHGYVHPEVLSTGYLLLSWLRGNILRGAAVTWFASFGRHLLQGPEKCIDVRPVQKDYQQDEPRTFQVSLELQQPANTPLLRWAHGLLGIFGLTGFGGSGTALFNEIRNMAQAHDRVLEGLDVQPNGIPITFSKEKTYES